MVEEDGFFALEGAFFDWEAFFSVPPDTDLEAVFGFGFEVDAFLLVVFFV